MSETYHSTVVVNKTADTPVVYPVVLVYPSCFTYSLQVIAPGLEGPVFQIALLGVPAAGSAFPDEHLVMWWNKEKVDSPALYNLTATFEAISGADVFLASNCLCIQRPSEAEIPCGKDSFNFGYITGNSAMPFRMRVVPSPEYVAENPPLTIIKMSFHGRGTPVLYGSRNMYSLFVGGDRDLLDKASIHYSLLLTINLSTAYFSTVAVSSNFTWNVGSA